jgi:DNA modification methylase
VSLTPYYQSCGITIYHGDCREVLPTLAAGSVDLVLTDPPYGVKRDKGFGGACAFGGGRGAQIERRTFEDNWDQDRPAPEALSAVVAAGRLSIVWGGNHFADVLPRATHWIVWDKLNTMPSFGDCELAWTNSRRTSVCKVTVQWNGLIGKEHGRWHPTQKPTELFQWCVSRYSESGQVILDPFMGSGTTLVAAKRLGRQAIGIELEERYCEIAAKRLAQGVLL